MFKFFPLPRPREILYSTLARCRTYLGLSTGSFARIVFGHPLSATIRTDRYLAEVAARLGGAKTAEELLLQHTLKPLYLPFGEQKPSRLRNRWLRFCPECITEQRQQYGEAYWVRDWQIKEAHVCLKHGCPLVRTPIPAGTCRHGFFNLELAVNLAENQAEQIYSQDTELLSDAVALLNADRTYRLQPSQWKTFYKTIMPESVIEDDGKPYWAFMYEEATRRWGMDWLKRHRLSRLMYQNNCDFRNPRWLYHYAMVRTCSPKLSLLEAVKKAANVSM